VDREGAMPSRILSRSVTGHAKSYPVSERFTIFCQPNMSLSFEKYFSFLRDLHGMARRQCWRLSGKLVYRVKWECHGILTPGTRWAIRQPNEEVKHRATDHREVVRRNLWILERLQVTIAGRNILHKLLGWPVRWWKLQLFHQQ
jgi:hypothetical protein